MKIVQALLLSVYKSTVGFSHQLDDKNIGVHHFKKRNVLQPILKTIASDLKVYVNNTRIDFVVHDLQTVHTTEHVSINMRQESIRVCPYNDIFSVITLFKTGFPPSE